MGKLFCLMGKSASGKDTIYQQLLQDSSLHLLKVVPYTTRPIRSGEIPGETYIYCSDAEAEEWERQGRIIELRSYDTIHGIWKYFTADDGQIDLSSHSYLMIGTLEAYEQLRNYFGDTRVVPLYIWLDDGLRLERALTRERAQEHPKYAELCRRFLADERDFSPENLSRNQIGEGFENNVLSDTLASLISYIGQHLMES